MTPTRTAAEHCVAVNALLRTIGDASQDMDRLRDLANSNWTTAAELESAVERVSAKAALLLRRFYTVVDIEAANLQQVKIVAELD